ncbi:MAG: nucleotide exchange factor GrpE [Planctomycetota bacterium]
MNDPQETGPVPDVAHEAAQVEAAGPDVAELQDRLLRLQAELENFRKRSRREYDEAQRYREIDLLRDLLPVLDNVNRAIDAAARSDDIEGLRAGFRMTGQQLEKLLASHGCSVIPTDGTPFDPTVHDAIQQLAAPGTPAGTVVATVSPGFRLHDRVVRPAQVIVAKEA